MTTPALIGFPDNVIDPVFDTLRPILSGHSFIRRPVRFPDPSNTISMYPQDWVPEEASVEIGPQFEPVLATYNFQIQTYVKSADKEEGRRLAAVDAKIVRAILYRDTDLALRLRSLEETIVTSTEKVKRFGVARTRFLNNDIQGTLVFLSTTNMWVETETLKA